MRSCFAFSILLALFAGMNAPSSYAQSVPPDDFLNEDDFDAPPPGTFVPSEPPPPMEPPPNFEPPTSTFTPPSSGGSSAPRKRRPISEASSDEITNENYPDLIDSFDYPNAEITDVIKAMSELTGKNFIVDPGVRGKITIIAPSKVTVAEAYKAFLSALAINGFSVVPSGKFLKVKQARDAQKDSIETYSGSYSPDTDQMITRIVHLKHISAADVNTKLRNLSSKFGDISVYEPTNSLILSDFGSNVERISGILKELDVKGFEEQLELMPIKYAKAKDIAELMDQIINKGKKNSGSPNSGGFTSGIPRFGQAQKTGGAADAFSLVIPDDRTNSIIVVGNRAGIEKIRELVAKLDRRVRPDEAGGVYVYYVKHGDAEKIASTLNGLATDAKKSQAPVAPGAPGAPVPADQVQPIFGGEVKIGHNKETNSLIVTASRQDYQVILNLMRKIDIPRDQVYVEAVIMEMSAGNSQNYGISYYKFNKDTGGIGRAGFSSGNLGTLLNPGSAGAILGFGSGETFDLKAGDQTVKVTSTLGFINFLKAVSTVNILSTPQILAMDNEEATIEVGETVPVSGALSQGSTTATTTATREDVTIKLKIKPHLSKTDDTIRLEFDQSIKSLSNTPVAASELAKIAVSTTKRSLVSNIVVRNGDTAVLGGLMKDEEKESVTKVPLLGDIPILGWLFKGKTTEKTKVNLLVFLTPRVIRTRTESNSLLGNKLTERVDYIRNNMGGRDPFGKDAEKMMRKVDMAKTKQKPAAPPAETEEDIPLEDTSME